MGKKTCIWAPDNPPPGLWSSDFRLPFSDFRLPTSDFRLPTSDFWLLTSEVAISNSHQRSRKSDIATKAISELWFGDCNHFGDWHWFGARHRFKARHRSIKFCTFQSQFWERLIRISTLGNHPRKILFWQKRWQLVPNLPMFNFVLIYKILHLPVPILGKTHKNKYPWEPS